MKKILCIVRVSTTQQETESQRNDMLNWLSGMGYNTEEIEVREYEGASARSLNAKYLNMLEDIKRITTTTTIKAVAIWHINRLGRVESKLMEMKEFFVANRVQLYVKQSNVTLLDENGNLTTGGSLVFSMFSAMVAEETAEMMEKFARGKAQRRSEGKTDGSMLPLGYIVTDDKRIEIDEKSAKIVRDIFDLYVTGEWSTTRLALELNERGIKDADGRDFTQSRVATILSKKAYTGQKGTKRVGKKGETKKVVEEVRTLPAIITTELFERCEALRKGAKVARKNNYRSAYLCNKLIRCKCGYNYTASNKVYRCFKEHDENVKRVPESERLQHTEATLSIAMMDGIVWQLAAHLEMARIANKGAESLADYREQLATAKAKAETAKAELTKIPTQREALVLRAVRYNLSDVQVDKMMESISQTEMRLQAEQQAAESDIERLSAAIWKMEHPVYDMNYLDSLRENLPENIDKKRAIVRSHIKQITVSDWETMTLNNMVTLFKSRTSEKRYLIITVTDFNGTEYKYRYFPRWSFGKSRLEEMLTDGDWAELVLAA